MKRDKKIFSLVLIVCFVISNLFRSIINVSAIESTPIQASSLKNEFRAVWLSTAYNIDWPSTSTSYTVTQQKQDYINKLDAVKATGMNALIFQVRSMGDAFYPSTYAPWSKYITGTLGKDPGYNPLSFALEEAHKRNLEFHAWFNPFRISTDKYFNVEQYINSLPVGSPLKSHPEWIVKYASDTKTYFWLNIANPEVRTYVVNTILEVVKNYDIDGIHLDDYFYPYPISGVDFPDADEFNKYGSGYASKEDWRRENVNKFVYELSTKIKAEKSYVKFGVSPFGIWKNGVSSGGSDTNGLSSYYSLYCDTVKWINNEWIDYIVPQIYWNFGYSAADYGKLIDWWTKQVSGKNVHLYIGQAAYKVGEQAYGSAWLNPAEMPNQIKYNRQFSDIKGSSFFSLKDILANRLGLKDALSTDLYKYDALIPTMSWKDNIKPISPSASLLKNDSGDIQLNWNDNSNGQASHFVVYRFDNNDSISISDNSKIIAMIRKGESNSYSYIDKSVVAGSIYRYIVTSVDRLYNESSPSNTVTNGLATIEDVTLDKQPPQKAFTEINFTIKASADKSILYKYMVYNGTTLVTARDYSSSGTFQWYPTRAGNYKIRVEVKTIDSKQNYDSFKELNYRVDGLKKIFIDPGHGGTDPGASGPTGVLEKDINLSISQKLKRELQIYGFDIMMSREDDTFIELANRAYMANSWNGNVFISVHQNSYTNPSTDGIETFHYPGSVNGQILASKVQAKLIENTGAANRGVKTASFTVLSKSNMPAILVESGFISNADKEAQLKTSEYQKVIANSISEGIFDYFNMNKEDLNMDGTVDILDVALVARNYNSTHNDDSSEKYLDLNDDNLIDIYDIVKVSKEVQ